MTDTTPPLTAPTLRAGLALAERYRVAMDGIAAGTHDVIERSAAGWDWRHWAADHAEAIARALLATMEPGEGGVDLAGLETWQSAAGDAVLAMRCASADPDGPTARDLAESEAREVVRRCRAYPKLRSVTLREAADVLRGIAGVIQDDDGDGEEPETGPHHAQATAHLYAAGVLERLADAGMVAPSGAPAASTAPVPSTDASGATGALDGREGASAEPGTYDALHRLASGARRGQEERVLRDVATVRRGLARIRHAVSAWQAARRVLDGPRTSNRDLALSDLRVAERALLALDTEVDHG